MKTPYDAQCAIYARLSEIQHITNPTNDKFMPLEPHELDTERDGLIMAWHEYQRYRAWFDRINA